MSRYIPEHPKKGTAEAYAWAEKMRAAREKKKRLRHQIRQAGLATEQEFFGPGGPLAPKALKKRKLNPGAKWHQGEEDVAYRYKKDAKDPLEKAFFAGVEAAHKTSGSAARKMGMNPSARKLIDHGFIRISDKEAGRLAKRSLRGKLPTVGHEILIQDDDGSFKWLARTPYSYRTDSPTRGWVWSIRDSQGWIIEDGRNILKSNPISHSQALACAKKLVKHEQESLKKNPIAVFNPPKVAGTIYNNAIEIKAQKTGGPLKGHYKHIFDSKKVKILGLTDGTVLLQHTEGKPLWMSRKDYERSGRKH